MHLVSHPALRVHFETPSAYGSILPTFKSLILAEESLTYLTRSLWKMSEDPKARWQRYLRAALALVLDSSPFHSRAFLQSRCLEDFRLEDFRLVRDLRTFTVTGNVAPTYRKELLRCARSPFTSSETIVAISNGHPRQAMKPTQVADHGQHGTFTSSASVLRRTPRFP
ncbi:hypothetical protein ABVK25_008050 [Lepraria finkii]|uniref:Uncharacterized protein n=1 Tax=Lepraria finkii TaxID=1340010 RepID=A0ABR4B3P7_9LECA